MDTFVGLGSLVLSGIHLSKGTAKTVRPPRQQDGRTVVLTYCVVRKFRSVRAHEQKAAASPHDLSKPHTYGTTELRVFCNNFR